MMPDFMLTDPSGQKYKLTAPEGTTQDDATAKLAASMTHYPEQPNPAVPYLQGAKAFVSGGLQGLANQQGIATPDWSRRAGEVLSSPEANAALGMAAPIKGTKDVLPRGIGRIYDPNRGINAETLAEMRAAQDEIPPLDPRPINPETLAEMTANESPLQAGNHDLKSNRTNELKPQPKQ